MDASKGESFKIVDIWCEILNIHTRLFLSRETRYD